MALQASYCGGIVINAKDFLFVAGLTGFITNLELRICSGQGV